MSRWGRSRGGWGDWGGYPERRARRAAPEHGIKVKKIGATWWGKQWVDALERMSSSYSNRLPRGATYARTGRVHDLEVRGGHVEAKVTGTRLYTIEFTIAPLPDAAWDAAIRAMAAQAVFSAKLLAGEMPQEIDEAFAAAGTTLFPAKASDLVTACSCPDYANPCKHVAAVHYVVGEAFDGDPFLLFELRGRSKRQVLDAIRAVRGVEGGAGAGAGAGAGTPGAGGAGGPRGARRAKATRATGSDSHEAPDASATVDASAAAEAVPFVAVSDADYERPRGDLAAIRFRVAAPAAHAAVVRGLGPPPRWSIDEPLADLLAPACVAASAFAKDLAGSAPGGEAVEATQTSPSEGDTQLAPRGSARPSAPLE